MLLISVTLYVRMYIASRLHQCKDAEVLSSRTSSYGGAVLLWIHSFPHKHEGCLCYCCCCSASSFALSSASNLSRSAFCLIFISVAFSKSLLAPPKAAAPPDGKLLALKLAKPGALPLLLVPPAGKQQCCEEPAKP